MQRGRKPAYPQEHREAFLAAVFREGLPYTRVAKQLRAGTLREDLKPIPVADSTCRLWKEKHERDTALRSEPDMATWQAIANDALRVLAREQWKFSRDSRSPKYLDGKRVRDHIAAIKEARPLIGSGAAQDDDQAEPGEVTAQQTSLLERLAKEQAAAAPVAAQKNAPSLEGTKAADRSEAEPSEEPTDQPRDEANPVTASERIARLTQPRVA